MREYREIYTVCVANGAVVTNLGGKHLPLQAGRGHSGGSSALRDVPLQAVYVEGREVTFFCFLFPKCGN